MRTRKGKYEEAIHGILEYLATNTDGGRAPRPILEEKFNLKESSASDIFMIMRERGLIEIRKFTVKKMDTIKIIDKGREEYQSRYQKGEYRIPSNVRKYLENRDIIENQLFPIQRDFVNRGLIFNRKNVCVFGYPGAGKTLVAEMAMANELTENGKVLYCTPYKALDWQKYNDFKESFKIFPAAKVSIADGDNKILPRDLLESKVIIATYEWVLRAIREKELWLDKVSLVCADELTLLGDAERGGGIDIVLTSLKNLPQKPRIITMSSLVGNALNISNWLEAESLIENRPAFPIPIEEHVVYPEKNKLVILSKEGARKEVKTDRSPFEVLIESNLEHGKTTIVFTGTKPGTEQIARRLVGLHKQNHVLQKRAEDFLSTMRYKTTQAQNVCNLISYGIAYHNAGLQKSLRKFIEELLHENLLKTVVATTTLSHGVDYHIDSAIIDLGWLNLVKGSLPIFEYINLKGRTGRPGKSKTASVYLLAYPVLSRFKIDDLFTKYFLSAPEPIFSTSTFSKDNVKSMILSQSIPELDIEKTLSLMSRTFQYYNEPKMKIRVNNFIENLTEEKFLKKIGNKIKATDLGVRVNQSNLSPSDAMKAVALPTNSDIDSILSLAIEIDVAKRIRFTARLKIPIIDMLKKWMKGESLDGFREDSGHFYDQELIDSVSYTSLSLKKMSILLEEKGLKKKIANIRKKLNRK